MKLGLAVLMRIRSLAGKAEFSRQRMARASLRRAEGADEPRDRSP